MSTFTDRKKNNSLKRQGFFYHNGIKLEMNNRKYWENLKYLQIKQKASK